MLSHSTLKTHFVLISIGLQYARFRAVWVNLRKPLNVSQAGGLWWAEVYFNIYCKASSRISRRSDGERCRSCLQIYHFKETRRSTGHWKVLIPTTLSLTFQNFFLFHTFSMFTSNHPSHSASPSQFCVIADLLLLFVLLFFLVWVVGLHCFNTFLLLLLQGHPTGHFPVRA